MIVSGFGGGRFEVDDGCIRPQPLELVVVPRLLIEHVDNHVAVVQQDPAGVLPALATKGQSLHLGFEFSLHIIRKRANMPIRGSGCDNEDVGDNQQLRNVEQRDIEALLVINRGGRRQGGCDGFRCRANCSVPSLGKGQS